MKPEVKRWKFGSIQVAGHTYTDDVLIRLSGSVEVRPKHLSKQHYGTSHRISLAEAQEIFEEGAEILVVGTGLFDRVRLSDEARAYLEARSVQVVLVSTLKVARYWNRLEGKAIGVFHVTC